LEHRANRNPVEVEVEIVEKLQLAFRDYPIQLVNCVGKPMLTSLAWLSLAHYCVAPWGAGLAKARWICNLPSYVLLSNFCREHKNDVRIYDDIKFTQNPTTLTFVPQEF